ncbi:hypothetical protein [Agromyces subbeticus]|uniref:hypothetical protein n=1 Tax=Agromyces subbeticus TaxID=293890 RepID=UPI0012ECA914|nr:hypothetical protein [Agromyces subbeticus]
MSLSPDELVDTIVRKGLGMRALRRQPTAAPRPAVNRDGEVLYVRLDTDLWARLLPVCDRLEVTAARLLERTGEHAPTFGAALGGVLAFELECAAALIGETGLGTLAADHAHDVMTVRDRADSLAHRATSFVISSCVR